MKLFFGSGAGRAGHSAPSAPALKSAPDRSGAYSDQFDLIKREGHRRPPPVIGAPTLVWHLGVWPKNADDPQDADVKVAFDDNCSAAERFEKALDQQARRRKAYRDSLNHVVLTLQERGRTPGGAPEKFSWSSGDDLNSSGDLYDEAVGFTLWWGDSGPVAGSSPGADSLRVRVHFEANSDFFTCSFYIDAGKAWGIPAVYGPSDPGFSGDRRRLIFDAINAVRQTAERRLHSSAIDADLLPEKEVSPEEARANLGAAQFLYEDIWEKFQADFKIDRAFLATGRGEIFADFRGLVAATADDAAAPGDGAARGYEPYAKFENAASRESNEANAVLKAWWPFLRRLAPNADYREFIASTLLNGRAIYVTPLGALDEFDARDEGPDILSDIPAGSLPKKAAGLSPIRYMFLSKGEPNRRQIGRMVERINNIGTLRLFALKDIAIIRMASNTIRMRGQHLDHVTNAWSEARKAVLDDPDINRMAKSGNAREAEELRNDRLTELTERVESHLFDISAALDAMGKGAAGALPFVVARSQKYIAQFQELVSLLKPGNIETWVSYDQFVQRGLLPTFEFIAGVGVRLRALRDRLQATTEAVQTSAVSIQTAATRHNTDVLSGIAIDWKKTQSLVTSWAIVLAFLEFDQVRHGVWCLIAGGFNYAVSLLRIAFPFF